MLIVLNYKDGEFCVSFDEVKEMLNKKENADNHEDCQRSPLKVTGDPYGIRTHVFAVKVREGAFYQDLTRFISPLLARVFSFLKIISNLIFSLNFTLVRCAIRCRILFCTQLISLAINLLQINYKYWISKRLNVIILNSQQGADG